MKTRRIVMIGCMVLLMLLLIDGVRYMMIINTKTNTKGRLIDQSYPDTNSGTGTEGDNVPDKPVNLLLLGLDGDQVRSDVITLLNLDPGKGKLNVLSIPRDTMVYHNGRRMKINALIGTGGEALTISQVEEMTGLKIDYYLVINFDGFRKIIDTLGGVTVDVPFDMNYDDPEQSLHIHLKKGVQLLNGDKAEQFVRYRKGNNRGEGYSEGDLGRVKAQQDFIKSLVEQKMKLRYITKAGDVLLTLQKYSKTNINLGDISYYYKSLRQIAPEDIKTYSTPGDSGYVGSLWYFTYDEEKMKELIESSFFQ